MTDETPAATDVQRRQHFLLMDWLVREYLPMWLGMREGLKPSGKILRGLTPVTSWETWALALPDLHSAYDKSNLSFKAVKRHRPDDDTRTAIVWILCADAVADVFRHEAFQSIMETGDFGHPTFEEDLVQIFDTAGNAARANAQTLADEVTVAWTRVAGFAKIADMTRIALKDKLAEVRASTDELLRRMNDVAAAPPAP